MEEEITRRQSVDMRQCFSSIKNWTIRLHNSIKLYIFHEAFTPSFACSLLYCTVLSFAGQMVTYLLSLGFTSAHVAQARTISVFFEVSATWITPWLMLRVGPIRTAIWSISWQMMCLSAGIIIFWKVDAPTISAAALVAATILSRAGLWGFDLSTQVIIQGVCITSIKPFIFTFAFIRRHGDFITC